MTDQYIYICDNVVRVYKYYNNNNVKPNPGFLLYRFVYKSRAVVLCRFMHYLIYIIQNIYI